jgi:peptidoglycan/LPS O-acetylase OafA/YrhL
LFCFRIESGLMTGRLRALDGLRGLLALYILAGHTAPFLRVPASAVWLGSILSHGRGAVELFFVLSGMVILRSLGTGVSRVGAGHFLCARAGRLLPVYAIALAAAAVALSCGDPFRALPWLDANDAAHDIAEAVWPQPWLAHLAAHMTLTQGLLPAAVLPNAEFTILGPAWSLSTEWQFYLVVAVILAFRRTIHAGGDDWRVFAGALIAVGVIGLLVDLLPAEWQPGRAFLPHEAWYFALGIASHGLLSSRGTRATRWWWALSLGAAAVLQWQQKPVMASVVPLLWTACLICEAHTIPSPLRPLAAVLNAAPMQWLGRISYPLYLIHMPVQRLLMLGIAKAVGGNAIGFTLLWAPAAILVPLIVASALHRWVEVPCWQWSRRQAEQRGRHFFLQKEAKMLIGLPASIETPIQPGPASQ